jgi:hypothetical protein
MATLKPYLQHRITMTPNQVRARLIERNSNLRRFALSHNYLPRTVQMVVTRYAGTGRRPRGILAWKILRDLSQTIGQPVIDGLGDLIE